MTLSSASPDPRSVADHLGLGSLADGEPGMDPDLLRDLYKHARGEDDERRLFEGDPSFTSGWVNLDSERARQLISAFVPLDDADSLKEARRTAQANLDAQPWNDLLEIEAPPIICKVKIHGAKWGLRFQSAEPAMRGREVVNENLPQIPIHDVEPEATALAVESVGTGTPADEATATHGPVAQEAPETSAAEDALRRGGLPT